MYAHAQIKAGASLCIGAASDAASLAAILNSEWGTIVPSGYNPIVFYQHGAYGSTNAVRSKRYKLCYLHEVCVPVGPHDFGVAPCDSVCDFDEVIDGSLVGEDVVCFFEYFISAVDVVEAILVNTIQSRPLLENFQAW